MADTPRMSDDDFRQLVMRTLQSQDQRHADHETRMAAHEVRMAQMDKQYDKLVEIQLEQASRQDEHERIMEQMRLTLDAIKEILRERRN